METNTAIELAAPAKPAALEGLPPVSDAVAATPKLVQSSSPAVQGPEMKKRELVDLVVKRSGVKKKDARQVVDAMLAVLGEALADSRELNLQPLGRLKVTRVKQTNGGQVMICKLRQNGGAEKADKEALAEDDD
jgi:DNA-binding protein HU-alpha